MMGADFFIICGLLTFVVLGLFLVALALSKMERRSDTELYAVLASMEERIIQEVRDRIILQQIPKAKK